MDVHIDRPILNKNNSPEQNIAIIDRWISDTTDKLNYLIEELNKEKEDGK